MNFYTRFNPPVSPSVRFTMPSLTEQAHAAETDINGIIARYKKTGVLGTPDQIRDMFFGDFSEVGSRFECALITADAKEQFMALPIEARREFGHSLEDFLKALDDPTQLERFVKVGLVKAPPKETATPDNPDPVAPSVQLDGVVNS